MAQAARKTRSPTPSDPSEAPDPKTTSSEPNVVWRPNPGPQTQFLSSTARECLYGGAAGGGKSAGLVAGPLRWAHKKSFLAVTFRRETDQLDDLVTKSKALYSQCSPEARFVATPHHQCTFPSGARHRYAHCQNVDDATNFQGREINLLQLDELTHFVKEQYLELNSRVRSTDPDLPRFSRLTTNPGGVGHDWVFERWGAWLNPDFEAPGLHPRVENDVKLPPARPGEILWILHTENDGEVYVPKGTPKALSRQFIPALLEDNPHLTKNDPTYEQTLLDNDPVRREQLRRGNWLIRPAAGLYFKRSYFTIVPAPPARVMMRVRWWDRAGTDPRKKTAAQKANDPDWTVGLRYSRDEHGIFYIEDVVRFRGNPHAVQRTICQTTEMDGQGTMVAWPIDPGQAGLFEANAYAKALAAFWFVMFRESGDKVTRCGPCSGQAQAGNIRLCKGLWNEEFIRELERFPTPGVHDDQVDALSGAHMALTTAPAVRPRALNLSAR